MKSWRLGQAALVVVFLFAANLFFYSGRFHSIDEMALLSTTESIVKWQRTDINGLAWGQWLLRGPDQQGWFNAQGDLYAKKAPLAAWLAAPLYGAAGLIGAGQVQAALLLNALLVALTGGVVFRLACRMGYRPGVAAGGALLFGLGTSALVYSKYLFSEPAAGLGLLLAAEAVWRARQEPGVPPQTLALGGAGLAAAILCNPVNVLFAPIVLGALVWAWRSGPPGRPRPSLIRLILWMSWPLALGLALMAAWNAARFGNPFTSGYHFGTGEGFTSPLRISLPGLLTSPARGFLWFVPAVFLALAGLPGSFRRHTLLAGLAAALIAAHLLVFGAWWMWWSGWGWGPRFLVPVTALAAILALPVLEAAAHRRGLVRLAVLAIVLVSVSVQILGAVVGFDEYEDVMTQHHLRGDPEGDLYKYGLDMLWSVPDSPIAGHARLLAEGRTDLAWLPGGQVDLLLLIPLAAWVACTGMLLARAVRPGAVRPRCTAPGLMIVAATCLIAGLLLWRTEVHPLRASYGFDPLEGKAALDRVAAASQPGDGALLVRTLTPGEMDRYPRFPQAIGIPDESLFGAEWNAGLERLVDNARARHTRLWLVVRSEEDAFAAPIAERLKGSMRRAERTRLGNYTVVLFVPR